MRKRVFLKLGRGSWETGFPTVIAQFKGNSDSYAQLSGSLPADLDLLNQYKDWQAYYEELAKHGSAFRRNRQGIQFDTEDKSISQISMDEFEQICARLKYRFNRWLNAESFTNIDRKLRSQLDIDDDIQFIVEVENSQVYRFPWHLWNFFEDYSNAEVSLSVLEYSPLQKKTQVPHAELRILAILGHSTGIETTKDQLLLQEFQQAETTVLVEPSREKFDRHLWDEKGWDILFFAGHSSSSNSGMAGQMELSPSETISVAQLKHGLRSAIANGLQLAIFNSCEGLGLARELADLSIPQLIVMREPVPDDVAQAFLLHFLKIFAKGETLYSSVRQARQRLQGLESQFPCASWLPVICQNPAVGLQDELELRNEKPIQKASTASRAETTFAGQGSSRHRSHARTRIPLSSVAIASFLVTGCILGLRSLGLLQSLELKTLDHLMLVRPKKAPDPRLLVITVDADDIDYQNSNNMQPQLAFSLSDAALTKLLQIITPHQPRAVGLDISHPYALDPPLESVIKQTDNFISACQSADNGTRLEDTQPASNLPIDSLGFSDFPVDPDGLVRRQLVWMAPGPPCDTSESLSLRLAQAFLAQEGIDQFTRLSNGDRVIGQSVLSRLSYNSGGYALPHDEASGYQILLNQRYVDPKVLTLRKILNGEVSPDELESLIRDRIILIGVDQSGQDRHLTANSVGSSTRTTPGVIVHGHMISQLLDAALAGGNLLWWWPQWGEAIWVAGWSLVGVSLAWRFKSILHLFLSVCVAILALYGLCLLTLMGQGWIPLTPAVLVTLLSSASVASLRGLPQNSSAQHSR